MKSLKKIRELLNPLLRKNRSFHPDEIRFVEKLQENRYLTQAFKDGTPVGRTVVILSTPPAGAYFYDTDD